MVRQIDGHIEGRDNKVIFLGSTFPFGTQNFKINFLDLDHNIGNKIYVRICSIKIRNIFPYKVYLSGV